MAPAANVVKYSGNLPWYLPFLGLKNGRKLLPYWVLLNLVPMLWNNAEVIYCHSTQLPNEYIFIAQNGRITTLCQ